MRTVYIEEAGNDKCDTHRWCVYIDESGEMRFRECRRCWIKQVHCKKSGNWKEISIWSAE